MTMKSLLACSIACSALLSAAMVAQPVGPPCWTVGNVRYNYCGSGSGFPFDGHERMALIEGNLQHWGDCDYAIEPGEWYRWATLGLAAQFGGLTLPGSPRTFYYASRPGCNGVWDSMVPSSKEWNGLMIISPRTTHREFGNLTGDPCQGPLATVLHVPFDYYVLVRSIPNPTYPGAFMSVSDPVYIPPIPALRGVHLYNQVVLTDAAGYVYTSSCIDLTIE